MNRLLTSSWWQTLCTPMCVACIVVLTANSASAAVEIELKERVNVSRSAVYIEDVAKLDGGDKALREKIASIDLLDLESVSASETITNSLVVLRLLIAGIDKHDFRVVGADESIVRRVTNRSADQMITAEISESLAERWRLPAEDIHVLLTRPVDDKTAKLDVTHDLTTVLEKEVFPGTNQIRLVAHKNNSLVHAFTVTVEVSITRELAIARTNLPVGTVVQASDFDLERRSFQDREAIGSPADVVGYKVIQVVRRGQALTNAVVRSAEAVALDEIVVKKRTLVRLVARRRNLTVTIPQAEALDDGRVGDTIRVRNPQSDRVVSGKVVDSGTVNVSL